MLVSLSFQFVGFLLTYILHSTHAAKFGSRAGLGFTLIQYGLFLKSRGEEMIRTGHFPVDPDHPDVIPTNPYEDLDFLRANWPPGYRTVPHYSSNGLVEIPSFRTPEEAKAWELDHASQNMTMADILQTATAEQVGQANEWLSFILLGIGWVLLLSSFGGYWRVKRFGKSSSRLLYCVLYLTRTFSFRKRIESFPEYRRRSHRGTWKQFIKPGCVQSS